MSKVKDMSYLAQALRWWRNCGDEMSIPVRHWGVLKDHGAIYWDDYNAEYDLTPKGKKMVAKANRHRKGGMRG